MSSTSGPTSLCSLSTAAIANKFQIPHSKAWNYQSFWMRWLKFFFMWANSISIICLLKRAELFFNWHIMKMSSEASTWNRKISVCIGNGHLISINTNFYNKRQQGILNCVWNCHFSVYTQGTMKFHVQVSELNLMW